MEEREKRRGDMLGEPRRGWCYARGREKQSGRGGTLRQSRMGVRLGLMALLALVWRAGEKTAAQGNAGAGFPEKGKFILHKFEQPIGEETFATTRNGETVNVEVTFKFTDRGPAGPLGEQFRGQGGLAPRGFG